MGKEILILATVCSNCLSVECWEGNFFCEEYKTAGIVHIGKEEDGLIYFYNDRGDRIPKLGRHGTLEVALQQSIYNM